MYFRTRYSSYEEFQRQAFDDGGRELGKDELDLLDDLWVDDLRFEAPPETRRVTAIAS